jgi:hypothetical protein
MLSVSEKELSMGINNASTFNPMKFPIQDLIKLQALAPQSETFSTTCIILKEGQGEIK